MPDTWKTRGSISNTTEKKGRGKNGARERLGMNQELRKVNLLLQNKTKQIWRNCDCEVHAPYREPSIIIFIKLYSVKLSSKHLCLYPKFTQAFSPHHRTSFLQSMAINKEWVALESSILNETPVSHSSHSAGSTMEEELELPLKQMLRRSQRLWLPEKDLVKTSPGQSPAQKRKGYRAYIKMKTSSMKDCWVEWPTRLPVIQSVAYTLAHRKALDWTQWAMKRGRELGSSHGNGGSGKSWGWYYNTLHACMKLKK